MRKIGLALLVFFFLVSCAHNQRGGEFRKARESVYKVQVTLKLDLTPINEFLARKEAERKKRDEERKKKEEEERKKKGEQQRKRKDQQRTANCDKHPAICYGSRGPFLAENVSVVLDPVQTVTDLKVISTSKNTATIGWSGTGWVAGHELNRTYVMTAGHVCESAEFYHVETFYVDWDTFEFEFVEFDLPIIEKKHIAIGRDGVENANSTVMRDEDLDDDYNGNDLCMLGVPGNLGPAVAVSFEDPEYGASCSVVGAPTGLWGGGIAVPSEAIFAGRGSVFGVEPDGLTFNGLLAPGNSGSAVICDGRAVGVISLGAVRFRSLVHAIPHDAIRKFMRQALHQPKSKD